IPILGISLLGAAIALIVYKNRSNNTQVAPAATGGFDEDE
ncbi:TPA: PTS sugar transporter subunit IIC, partial [Enterococcus faecium]|nr:PTS sugar transporter subunit IIC [Enterococcus faecium]